MNLSQAEELRDLKARCLNGQEEAWKELIERMLPIARNIGRYHFKLTDETARDLAQDTVIKMVQTLASIENIRSWVSRVMRNKCIDYFRKKKEYLSEDNREMPDLRSPLTSMEHMEIQSVLKEALQTLPERCRDLLRMRFLEGHDHKVISQVLNVPYSQVPVNQARCLKKMKAILEADHPQIWEMLESL